MRAGTRILPSSSRSWYDPTGTRASRFRSIAFRHGAVAQVVVGLAVLILLFMAGAAVTQVGARNVAMAVGALTLVVIVAIRPAFGAFLLIGLTPLIGGIDRGRIIPLLRPAEALAMVIGAGLMTRWIIAPTRIQVRLGFGRVDGAILAMAVTSSLIPLAWELIRAHPISQDDLLYSLMIWKYFGIYAIFRASVRTMHEVRICLWISMIAAAAVAVIGILQSLQLFGVPSLLASYFAPYGSAASLFNSRGGSTLSLPIAVADLMTIDLAVALGFYLIGERRQRTLIALAIVFVFGTLSSGEFSGAIALLVGVVVLCFLTRSWRLLVGAVPVFLGSAIALRPVIETRLSGFQGASGLPTSWIGRIHNLTGYFWPVLFSHGNFLLGVQVAARVPTSTMATGYVWIESGYTWLLWSGGVPLLLAFLWFLVVELRVTVPLSRRADPVGVAALAVATALIAISVLMLVDPHLTYRGSADMLFALIGICGGRAAQGSEVVRS